MSLSFRKKSNDDLPPAGVRFTELRTETWQGGGRYRVLVSITPFQQNPNLQVVILDSQQQEMAHTLIIETAENRIVFTMHLRRQGTPPYFLHAELIYPEIGVVDTRRIALEDTPTASDSG